jgi:hypothetical protein
MIDSSDYQPGKPDAAKIRDYLLNIQEAEADVGGYLTKKQRNYETRHAIWSGQSPDGRKHSSALGKQAFPWEGSSDARVRLADQITNENVALLLGAFFRAKLQLQPIESGDAAAKVAAETALKWMLFQHCADDLRREIELLAQYQEQYGLGIMGVFWRRTTRTEEKTITLDDFQAMLAETGDPIIQVLLESIMDPLQEDDAAAMLRDLMGPDAGKVRIIRDLRNTGAATYDNPYLFENRPEFVALEPWEDIFFPAQTGDLQRARFVAWRETVTETELRERIVTDGYSEKFVTEALKHKGAYRRPIRNYYRQELINLETERESIELWHYYEKQSNKDNTTRVHYCVLHDSVREDVGLNELLPYTHGDYPFIEFARERISRVLLESRGIPEVVQSAQEEIKVQRDMRSDRASISTLPPVRVPANRGKLNLIFGPGAQVAERRPNEFGWMEPPRFDSGTIEIEAATRRDIDEYFGRFSQNVPGPLTMLMQQTAVDRWLRSCKALVAQAFALMQQYVTDQEIMRVSGAMPAPFQVTREAIQGKFDLVAEFDVRDLDDEHLGKKLQYIAQVAVPLDVAGVIDRANLVKFIVGAVDPSLANQIVRSEQAATAAEAEEEQLALTKISAGIEPPLPEQGVNPQLRLQVLQGAIQANPQLQQRYAQDEIYKAMVDARGQALQFQMTQIQNAQIGRVGAVPALAAQPQTMGGAFAARGSTTTPAAA